MSTNLRIHIVPVGYDSSRVSIPLINGKADKVFFIRHTSDKKNESAFFEKIKKDLKKLKQVKIEQRFLNIWDLYDCLEEYRKIILNEKNNHVYVNVSSGTKVTAIAGMLSCMSWRAIPYYARVTYPAQIKIKNIPKEVVEETTELPVYRINKPEKKFMVILKILKDNNDKIRKWELIDQLETLGIIKQQESSETDFSIYAKHSQLRAILSPMENDWKFIKTKTRGRRSEIFLNDQGKKALRIFGIDDTDSASDT